MIRPIALAVAATLLLGVDLGCGVGEQRPQWVVVVATDAPVPQFGDLLAIEVIDGEGRACEGCRRIFDATAPSAWPISFGVVPSATGNGTRVRARLYRSIVTGHDGLPARDKIIDATGRLPAAPSGVARVALNLRMDCFGVAPGVLGHQTCDPGAGQLADEPTLSAAGVDSPPAVGSWPQAQRVACSDSAPDGMVCVPGGVFLLGDPRPNPGGGETSSAPEHLVKLSPYFIDIDEVTVGQVRPLVASGAVKAPVARASDPTKPASFCTYQGTGDTSDDALPVNCVSHDLAISICKALGKRLPTEAEWEYAAGNLGRESSFPWGNDDDVCAHAIAARGNGAPDDPFAFPSNCTGFAGARALFGPVAGGADTDVTDLGIRNLAGNLDEWAADVFSPYSTDCWAENTQMLVDPVCTAGPKSNGGTHAVRGSSWGLLPVFAAAYRRDAMYADSPGDPQTGLRCARSM